MTNLSINHEQEASTVE